MAVDDPALRAFLTESHENLIQLEQDLVELEKQPEDASLLSRAFRTVHTVKGTCGFFGFNTLETLSHAFEDVLASLRDNPRALELETINTLLDAIDAIRGMLAEIEAHGQEQSADYQELTTRLKALLADSGEDASVAREKEVEEDPPHSSAGPVVDQPQTAGASNHQRPTESSIRVDVELLDRLMNLVGELVLARNQLLQHAATREESQLHSLSQRFNLVTSELQENLMQTRMQAIGDAWSVYPRLIRDLEQQTGKRVNLETSGGETELDRSLLDAIRDPLLHLLRNAVDHGIESPEERIEAGKPEAGRLSLRATQESGNVIVELSDDGVGIDTDSVVARALQRGLIRPEDRERLTDHQLLQLIFQPGFTTAEDVSNLSGRGVGLDVVKSAVERIGGSVDLSTEVGKVTTTTLRIPLTLAIVHALIVSCADQRFAIPEANLLEIVHVPAEESARRIEQLHDTRVYRLRGQLLPLVELRDALRLGERKADGDLFILVLKAESGRFGLVVDQVSDTEEIVVKPLGKHLREVGCFAGATIMGDGEVALILDILAVARNANLAAEREVNRLADEQPADSIAEVVEERHAMLLVSTDGARGRAALPLGEVDRLEEFPAGALESSAGREVVQYRGGILPLLRLDRILHGSDPAGSDEDNLQVVVHHTEAGDIGLVVGDVLDIVDTELEGMERTATAPGVSGSAIIGGAVTDLLDLGEIVSHSAIYGGLRQ